MKVRSPLSFYLSIFLISAFLGIAAFILIGYLFQREFSNDIVVNSVLLGSLAGMGGLITVFVARFTIRKAEKAHGIRKLMVRIAFHTLLICYGASLLSLIMYITVYQIEYITPMPMDMRLTFMLMGGGMGLGISLLIMTYEHTKIALEKSYQKVREKELLEKELQVARQVQAGFLPSGPIQIEGFDVSTFFRSAKEVGGDYFDIIPLKKGVGIVIADVSGKGIPAALVMANLHATLHTLADDCCTVESVTRINRSLFKDTPSHLFVTFFIGKLNNLTGEFTYINAGHNPPVVVRQDGTLERLTKGGMVLGISLDSEFETDSVVLKPGDLLLLYTDGLTEAGLPEIEPLGEKNVMDLLIRFREKTTDSIVESIIKEVEESTKGILQTDDMAMILLKRKR